MSQIFNLKDNEQDILAGFLGHDIRVHREFYRLPQNTLQIAKVSRILMAFEKGNIGEFKNKGLDEIEINIDDEEFQEMNNNTDINGKLQDKCMHIDDEDVSKGDVDTMKVGPYSIMKNSILDLGHKKQLSDDIVNSAIYIATREKKAILFFDHNLMTSICLKGEMAKPKKINLSKYEMVIGAMFEGGETTNSGIINGHWTLVVVKQKSHEIIYLNSTGESKETMVTIQRNWNNYASKKGEVSTYTILKVDHTMQDDAVSCGVLVIK
ncbi:uncharacterized protein LOC144348610, partial [Saccoglossus kowalevskii]